MLNIIISGCNGHMGQVVQSLCEQDPKVEVTAGFDVLGTLERPYPVFSTPAQCTKPGDVVIDFSSPAALEGLLEFAVQRKVPLVLATTGYSQEQVEQIEAASKRVPLFRSANMSLGINLLLELVKRAAAVLGESYDIEIVERHHRRKVDAPSGTALMLAQAAAEHCGHPAELVYDRHSVRHPREQKEIGISALRGGTIVGEHEIIFAGHDEVIEIKHSALSREIFAKGALEAAKFMAGITAPGLYDMSALLRG